MKLHDLKDWIQSTDLMNEALTDLQQDQENTIFESSGLPIKGEDVKPPTTENSDEE